MTATDEELVARAVAVRDQAAFGELVRRHQSRIRAWLRQLARNAATADDIAQETFIKAWDKLHTFNGQGQFAGWLMKIAYTEFLMSHRKAKSNQRLAAAVEMTESPAHDPTGAESVATDLQRMLAILSEEERASMVLCYAHGHVAQRGERGDGNADRHHQVARSPQQGKDPTAVFPPGEASCVTRCRRTRTSAWKCCSAPPPHPWPTTVSRTR